MLIAQGVEAPSPPLWLGELGYQHGPEAQVFISDRRLSVPTMTTTPGRSQFWSYEEYFR